MNQYQFSMFDNPTACMTDIERCVSLGSGFEGGRVRIYAAYNSLPENEFIQFIKEEYGTGGHGDIRGNSNYDSKGLSYRKWKEQKADFYTWKQISKEISKLINYNIYLSEKDKEKIKEIKKNHNGILPLPMPRFHYE